MVFRTKISQKNQTHFCIGIQGYRDTRPSVGGRGQKSETRETKHLKNHGDTGIRGIRRIRELSQKNQTHFFMGIQGYEGYEGYKSSRILRIPVSPWFSSCLVSPITDFCPVAPKEGLVSLYPRIPTQKCVWFFWESSRIPRIPVSP